MTVYTMQVEARGCTDPAVGSNARIPMTLRFNSETIANAIRNGQVDGEIESVAQGHFARLRDVHRNLSGNQKREVYAAAHLEDLGRSLSVAFSKLQATVMEPENLASKLFRMRPGHFIDAPILVSMALVSMAFLAAWAGGRAVCRLFPASGDWGEFLSRAIPFASVVGGSAVWNLRVEHQIRTLEDERWRTYNQELRDIGQTWPVADVLDDHDRALLRGMASNT